MRIGRRASCLGVVLALGFAVPACRATGPDAQAVPDWVAGKNLSDEHFIYAVGACPFTSVPADREARAIEAARAELGRVIRTEVRSISTSTTTVNRETYRGDSESESQAVLRESEVAGKWLDRDGRMGSRGTLWILVRIPRGRLSPHR